MVMVGSRTDFSMVISHHSLESLASLKRIDCADSSTPGIGAGHCSTIHTAQIAKMQMCFNRCHRRHRHQKVTTGGMLRLPRINVVSSLRHKAAVVRALGLVLASAQAQLLLASGL